MSKSIKFLRDLAQKLQNQDNACTASPNYCIQEHVQLVGIDMDYAPSEGWFNCGDEYQQADDKKAKALDRYYERYGKEPDGWTKLGYEWQWKYTGISFLTHDAAHAYVDNNKNRHRNELRVYVDSHYRNAEMREVRRLLAGPVAKCIEALQQLMPLLQRDSDRAVTGIYSVDTWHMIDKINAIIKALDTAKEPHQ